MKEIKSTLGNLAALCAEERASYNMRPYLSTATASHVLYLPLALVPSHEDEGSLFLTCEGQERVLAFAPPR